MAIPDYQTIMLPLLECLRDKKLHKISDLIEKLTDEFKLTDEEREMKYENGKHRIFSNRVRWARLYLKKAGLVNDPERGYLMSLFQNFPHTFFQHRMKHAISNSPLKTTLSLSYLLANFLNPIFNHAKNRSIVPLFE